jgi:hypothetical protein
VLDGRNENESIHQDAYLKPSHSKAFSCFAETHMWDGNEKICIRSLFQKGVLI